MSLRSRNARVCAHLTAHLRDSIYHSRRFARTAQAAVCCVLLLAAGARAAGPMEATSSRAAREDAIRTLPLEKLQDEDQAKVAGVLADASLYRRLPIQVLQCDPTLFLFLVRHPDVVVNIWEVMKISNVGLVSTGPDTFRATDNAGTVSEIKYCYSDHETQVIYAESAYNGPLFKKPLRAKVVLMLKSGYTQEPDGRHYVTSRMDTFIQIENLGAELLAKTLQMLVLRSADYNFVETAAYAGMISHAAEVNSTGIHRLAGKLNNIDPQVRDRFAELTLEVGSRARERQAIQASANLPLPSQRSQIQDR